jgi:hypothetical protein
LIVKDIKASARTKSAKKDIYFPRIISRAFESANVDFTSEVREDTTPSDVLSMASIAPILSLGHGNIKVI